MKSFHLSLVLLLICVRAVSQDIPAYEKRLFVNGVDTLPYRILYPLHFKPSKKYPLLVFLHGSGERGNDNVKQLVWGGKLFADSANRKNFPAIIIFPQCAERDFWALMGNRKEQDSLGGIMFYTSDKPSKSLQLVMNLLDSVSRSGSVNKKQIYVGGISMGGMGCFEILWRKPGFFAGALAICGGGAPEMVTRYANGFPIWVFHGDRDPAVKVSNSRLMVSALKKAGAMVRYSEYPGVQHDSWNNALAEPDLLKWLYQQKKKK